MNSFTKQKRIIDVENHLGLLSESLSVMSNYIDYSPGQNTGMGSIPEYWNGLFSRPEYWNRLPFLSPEDLPDPGIKPGSPALQADSLPSELQVSPKSTYLGLTKS